MMAGTTKIGRDAEDLAGQFLEHRGFRVVARNWRTRCCELDLIVKKCRRGGLKSHCKVHIVEVKYRKSKQFGEAAEYVTPAKVQQLVRAAEHWAHEQNWRGDYQIDVVAIDGYGGTVAYIPNVTG